MTAHEVAAAIERDLQALFEVWGKVPYNDTGVKAVENIAARYGATIVWHDPRSGRPADFTIQLKPVLDSVVVTGTVDG